MKRCKHGCGSKTVCGNFEKTKCRVCRHYGIVDETWKCYFKKPNKSK